VDRAAPAAGGRPPADLVGVAPDPEPVGRRGNRPCPLAPVPPRVPGEGEAAGRVESRDPFPGNASRAGAGRLVAAVGLRVVQPAGMAADVDGRAGDGHGGEAVTTAVVGPGRLEAAAPGGDLP